jgi:hypothetical protein
MPHPVHTPSPLCPPLAFFGLIFDLVLSSFPAVLFPSIIHIHVAIASFSANLLFHQA